MSYREWREKEYTQKKQIWFVSEHTPKCAKMENSDFMIMVLYGIIGDVNTNCYFDLQNMQIQISYWFYSTIIIVTVSSYLLQILYSYFQWKSFNIRPSRAIEMQDFIAMLGIHIHEWKLWIEVAK